MDVQEDRSQGLAQVLSLSLHRLSRAPRAVHRAFLSRPSLFRVLRNVKGAYHADGVSFLKDRGQTELCFVQMISQAQDSVLVLSDGRDPILQSAINALKDEKPHVKLRECVSQKFVLVIDERVALIAKGGFGIVVEGPIAKQISDHYQISIRKSPRELTPSTGVTNWPFRTRLDLETIKVGLSRTWTLKDRSPLIEIERLTLTAIRSAKRFVYLELNQFTSPVIAKAIMRKLEASDGPEFVMLLPPRSTVYLEDAMIAQILKADHFERFHVFEKPLEKFLSEETVSLMIVDDQFVKIGTSQFTSKSLGNSDEIDLSIEALGRPHVVMAIARLRRERLGALLGLDPAEFDARFLLNESLSGTIYSFFTNTRSLREKLPDSTAWTQAAVTLSPLLDPKRPAAVRRWLRKKARFAPLGERVAFFSAIIFALLIMFASLFAQLRV